MFIVQYLFLQEERPYKEVDIALCVIKQLNIKQIVPL